MARLSDFPDDFAKFLAGMKTTTYQAEPFVHGPPLTQRRVAIITTAGVHLRDQPRFEMGDTSYRVLPGDIDGDDLIMSQGSVGFDRTGFQQDVNTVFPIDRLREMVRDEKLGSLASAHYSLSSAFSSPLALEPVAGEIAQRLHEDQVDAVVLIPA